MRQYWITIIRTISRLAPLILVAQAYSQNTTIIFTARLDETRFRAQPGTPTLSTQPYSIGTDYTFYFELNPLFEASSTYQSLAFRTGNVFGGAFPSGIIVVDSYFLNGRALENRWVHELTTTQPLFISVGGSGLSGTWATPGSLSNPNNIHAPFSEIFAYGGLDHGIGFTAAAENYSSLSVQTISGQGSRSLWQIQVDLGQFDTSSLPFPGVFLPPTEFFSPISGTTILQTSSSLTNATITIWSTGAEFIPFAVTQMEVTTSAIPEPEGTTTYICLFSLIYALNKRGQSKVRKSNK